MRTVHWKWNFSCWLFIYRVECLVWCVVAKYTVSVNCFIVLVQLHLDWLRKIEQMHFSFDFMYRFSCYLFVVLRFFPFHRLTPHEYTRVRLAAAVSQGFSYIRSCARQVQVKLMVRICTESTVLPLMFELETFEKR